MLLSLLYSSALHVDSVFVCFTVCTYPKQRKDSWSQEEVTQVDDNLLCSCKMDKSFSASVHKVLARWVCRSSAWRCNQSNLETRWTDWPTDQHIVDIWYWIRVFIKCISYIVNIFFKHSQLVVIQNCRAGCRSLLVCLNTLLLFW